MQYTLIIEDRNGIITDELTFEQGSFSIGRNEGNDILLPSRSVSRHHARVFTEAGHVYIEDLNSSNGVVVDGRRIMGITELGPGSQIRVGDFLLLFKTRKGPQDSILTAGRAAQPEAATLPRLIRVGDEREGDTYPLQEIEIAIGRTDDNFLVFKDSSVSRHHAQLFQDRGRMVAVDLGSSNGTRINGQLIHQPAILNAGDIVSFGNLRFIFAQAGQSIDINDYRKQLTRSNRGLVIAVTILALLLVFITSSIAAFLILEKDEGPPPITPDTALQRADSLCDEGDILTRSEQWDEAIARYSQALGYQPEHPRATQALARARSEKDALHIIEAADQNISNGDAMERQGNRLEASLLLSRAREQLGQVQPDSVYHTRATDRITLQIDPSLVRIQRQLGADFAQSGRYAESVAAYESALQTLQLLPEDRRPDLGSEIRAPLWNALVAAADAAAASEDWVTAVRYYERAQEIGELPRQVVRRLQNARRHLP
ncbi:MAG: FHA domain-containing protein [Bradymonadales bacterium]|nr:FHA domain-containing protein [Bradymonadales bacterium]